MLTVSFLRGGSAVNTSGIVVNTSGIVVNTSGSVVSEYEVQWQCIVQFGGKKCVAVK